VLLPGANECDVGVSVAAVRQRADEGRRHVALQSGRRRDGSTGLSRGGRQRTVGRRRAAPRRRLRQPRSRLHHRRQRRPVRGR